MNTPSETKPPTTSDLAPGGSGGGSSDLLDLSEWRICTVAEWQRLLASCSAMASYVAFEGWKPLRITSKPGRTLIEWVYPLVRNGSPEALLQMIDDVPFCPKVRPRQLLWKIPPTEHSAAEERLRRAGWGGEI